MFHGEVNNVEGDAIAKVAARSKNEIGISLGVGARMETLLTVAEASELLALLGAAIWDATSTPASDEVRQA